MAYGLKYEKLASLSSATGLTPPADAYSCTVSVETQAVRYRADGTDPTAAEGIPIAAGEERNFVGPDTFNNLKFIEQSASATIYVHYWPRTQ